MKMRWIFAALGVSGCALLMGCSQGSVCAPGQSMACTCNDGRAGAQVCGADNTYGACDCSGGSADLGSGDDLRGIASVKRVFATSASYNGDLVGHAGISGGRAAADKLCSTAAQGAAVGGTWKAWLSYFGSDALDAINDVGPWYLMDGQTRVFNSKVNLTTTPLVPIDLNEFGQRITAQPLLTWTGTAVGGRWSGVTPCSDWTYAGSTSGGAAGSLSQTGSTWTNNSNEVCSRSLRLYCFEQ